MRSDCSMESAVAVSGEQQATVSTGVSSKRDFDTHLY
jgi:hypothetical protein